MRETVVLPDIGEGVVEGEVVRWLKKEGERVQKDEAVVVVMTDKATVELPTPFAGVLAKCYVSAGEKALLGKPLYDVETEVQEPLATPRTRQLAKELGVDLTAIKGTGQGGRITDDDLVHFQKREFFEEIRPQVGVRQMIAEKMTLSKETIPQFSFFDRLDATSLIEMRKNEWREATFMPFIIRALSLTMSKYPELNSSLEGKNLHLYQHQNIGVAIDSGEGLIVASLKNVQEKNLEEIISAYQALMKKVKEKKHTRDDLTGSTITISNFGTLGGRWATPIINPPEVAILGVAKISDEVVAHEGVVVIRPLMNLSWSFDHRVIDGSLAAKASNHFIHLLENPAELK